MRFKQKNKKQNLYEDKKSESTKTQMVCPTHDDDMRRNDIVVGLFVWFRFHFI